MIAKHHDNHLIRQQLESFEHRKWQLTFGCPMGRSLGVSSCQDNSIRNVKESEEIALFHFHLEPIGMLGQSFDPRE